VLQYGEIVLSGLQRRWFRVMLVIVIKYRANNLNGDNKRRIITMVIKMMIKKKQSGKGILET